MTERQTFFFIMANRVVAHFNQNRSAYESEDTVVQAFALLVALNVKGQALVTRQNDTAEGHTEKKNLLFDDMIESTYVLARKASMYARKQKDQILLNVVDISMSDLERGGEMNSRTKCQSIANKLKELVSPLAAYKITQEQVDQLDQKIAAYSKAPSERDVVDAEHGTTTLNLKDLITEMREVFVELDDAVYTQIEGQKEFKDTYRTLRKIGGRSTEKIQEEKEKESAVKA